MKKNHAHFDRIRFEFPPVKWLTDTNRYVIDARSKGGGRHYRTDRAEALALAEKLAADFEFKGRSAFSNPDIQTEKLSELGITAQEVIAEYLRQQHAKSTKSIAEAFDAFERHKSAQGLRHRSLKSVLPEIRRFMIQVGSGQSLGSITLAHISEYLMLQASSPGTHNTKRKHLCTFFNFCVAHDWIIKNPVDKVVRKKETIEVHVATPDQVERLLLRTFDCLSEPAASSMRAYLALAVFAGIRPEEIHRLNWRDINLEQSVVYISKATSKTNDDREVPILPNCKAWLTTCVHRTGPVAPSTSFATRLLKLREACGIETWRKPGTPWPHDVLRHTFGSSWLAIHKNRPLLAEIMGNSVNIITRHYKRTLSVAQAQALFSIMPPGRES
jgi:integrase